MTRQDLYNLCMRWGEWSSKMDGLGYPGITPYHRACLGDSGEPSSDSKIYINPDQDVARVNKYILSLQKTDLALINAHFKHGMSYSKIGELIHKSKSCAQKRICCALKKLLKLFCKM